MHLYDKSSFDQSNQPEQLREKRGLFYRYARHRLVKRSPEIRRQYICRHYFSRRLIDLIA